MRTYKDRFGAARAELDACVAAGRVSRAEEWRCKMVDLRILAMQLDPAAEAWALPTHEEIHAAAFAVVTAKTSAELPPAPPALLEVLPPARRADVDAFVARWPDVAPVRRPFELLKWRAVLRNYGQMFLPPRSKIRRELQAALDVLLLEQGQEPRMPQTPQERAEEAQLALINLVDGLRAFGFDVRLR